ncbi:hypothetical protein FH972_021921 [Carpinus fangiana]|uniref:Short-chain dehydrogenase n=1 Tax=Carpinus fangiana TaxID=176857 RepID=A0A5N6KQQ3_9ROSI|nr:hypothetical protein FH972_021921 [Carpinus fangiana]
MVAPVFIVTGASRGIGLAISKALLAEQPNCKLVAVARNAEKLQELADKSDPQRVAILSADLSDTSTAQRAINLALSKFGSLDGLVINHGIMDPVKRICDADIEGWKTAFDTNVFSAIVMIRAAIPALRTTHGRIVLVSSGASIRGYAAWGCYGMTKAALNHLALTLANEEADITTVSIRPGMVDTQMQVTLRDVHHSVMNKDDVAKFSEAKTSGKLLKPNQPGNVIARLVIGAPKALSGSFLSWDDQDKLGKFQDP